jgi:release factor glutamine methyltransferase
MTVGEALVEAAARLTAVSETARLDAMLLSRMDAAAPAAFEAAIRRRLEHEPVAYIVGRRDFWSIELEVGSGVLVPRPDSEALIEAALEHFGAAGPERILDLGTGPGTLLLAALAQWPQATGLGIDRSGTALAFARRNAARLGLEARAAFRTGDWAEGIAERFDLLLCNPPYVEDGADLPREVAGWEPDIALYAGADGLAVYRRLAPRVPHLIAPAGLACFEIGAGQAAEAGALFEAMGLKVKLRKDLAGRDRCLVLGR